jgi:hypothetical protein
MSPFGPKHMFGSFTSKTRTLGKEIASMNDIVC